jgi:hypothetical protein
MRDDGIEQLRKKLYSRQGSDFLHRRRVLRARNSDVADTWDDRELPSEPVRQQVRGKRPLSSMLLIASGAFFVLSLGLSAYFLLSGSNFVSSENIDIELQGPTTVEGGAELPLQIGITNKNSVAIELADLIVEFPEGTREPEDLSVELTRVRESLGTINSGDREQRTVRAVLFGPENSEQLITVTVEYRVKDSNAIFYTEKTYAVTLSSSPLTITVDALKEIASGQTVDMEVTVTSNSNNTIENVLLTGEYPFGFTFAASQPKASFGSAVWELGDIQPGGKRAVRIQGKIVGEDEEERVFRFSAGVQSDKDPTELATSFLTILHGLTIKKPFLGVELALNGNTGAQYVAARGEQIRADVRWTNNLPDPIEDARIEVKLSGEALNRFSVSAERGFYRSVDNTIVWDQETNPTLATIPAGGAGTVSFSFSSLDLTTALHNQQISLEISVGGKRVTESNVPETMTSSISRTVKLSTNLILTPRILFYSGPFTNAGPIPPRADRETTYTVMWTASNSSNRVTNATVVASLPSYVRWVGNVSPTGEDISFSNVGGQITWKVGELPAGGKKEAAFQIAFTPSVSQIGNSPILINDQTLSGTDEFTSTVIEAVKRGMTSNLTTDAGFPLNGGVVTQ